MEVYKQGQVKITCSQYAKMAKIGCQGKGKPLRLPHNHTKTVYMQYKLDLYIHKCTICVYIWLIPIHY